MVSRYALGGSQTFAELLPYLVRSLPAHRHIERIKRNSKAIGRRQALGLIANASNFYRITHRPPEWRFQRLSCKTINSFDHKIDKAFPPSNLRLA